MSSCYSLFVLAILFNILLKSGIEASVRVVQLDDGQVLGKVEKNNYCSFKGIPYAKPPLNELRFEPPKKPTKWQGILDTREFASTCLRLEIFSNILDDNKLVGSEDCLYLNVFAPNVEEPVPVLIYIHQGGFISGSGDDLLETRIMEHQSFVLVTFNYRLGPLGFLSTGDKEISGNMGLKDQRMVLEWVNENIHHFGGDPTKVLLTGFSAGAASVQYHLLTEGIDTLVKAAWSFSGSALNPWAIVSNPAQQASKFGALLNCSTELTSDLKKCLKSLSADLIVTTVNKFFVYKNNPFRIFGPVVEHSNKEEDIDSNAKPFITSTPKDLIKAGHCSNTIPWITSFTKEDGGVLVAQFLDYKPNGNLFMEDLNENFYEYLPMLLYYGENMSQEELNNYTDALLVKYGLIKGQFNEESYKNMSDLFTDFIMKNGIMESIYLHKHQNCGPVYSYMYNNPASFGFGNLFIKRTDVEIGTVHGDDMFLILNYPPKDQHGLRLDEKLISRKLIKMMEDFILTGTPLYGGTTLRKNTAKEAIKFLEITGDETFYRTFVDDKELLSVKKN